MAKGKPTGKKSDAIEKAARIRYVQDQLLAGHYTADIIDSVVLSYQVSERQAYNYLKDAVAEFKAFREKDVENQLGRHIATRWHLYKELLDAGKGKRGKLGDPKIVAELRALLQDIAKLEGLYIERSETKVNGQITHITGMDVK
jgi:hypothetical protein